jgi:hypothetical protein
LPLNFVEPVKLRVVMTDLAFGVHDTTTDVKKTFLTPRRRMRRSRKITTMSLHSCRTIITPRSRPPVPLRRLLTSNLM